MVVGANVVQEVLMYIGLAVYKACQQQSKKPKLILLVRSPCKSPIQNLLRGLSAWTACAVGCVRIDLMSSLVDIESKDSLP